MFKQYMYNNIYLYHIGEPWTINGNRKSVDFQSHDGR